MTINLNGLILIAAIFCTTLMAGFFYAWSYSVLPGLKALTNEQYLYSMQSMNRAILNPMFFLVFIGSIILLPTSTVLEYRAASSHINLLLLACIIYLIGSIGVTFFANVPINNVLNEINLAEANEETFKNQRAIFEKNWTRLNLVRTYSSFSAAILLLVYLFKSSS